MRFTLILAALPLLSMLPGYPPTLLVSAIPQGVWAVQTRGDLADTRGWHTINIVSGGDADKCFTVDAGDTRRSYRCSWIQPRNRPPRPPAPR